MRSAIESAFVSPRPSTRRKQGESVAEAVLISFNRVAVGFPQIGRASCRERVCYSV